MPRTPRSVGAYGSTRGKERQRRKANNRAQNPRYQRAMEERAAEEKRLEKLGGDGPAAGAAFARQCLRCVEGERDSASVWCAKCRGEVAAGQTKVVVKDPKLESYDRIQLSKPEYLRDSRVLRVHEAYCEYGADLKSDCTCKVIDESTARRIPVYLPKPLPKVMPWKLRVDGDPVNGWSIRDARTMFRHGYNVNHVMETTGVGYKWLDDLPMDDEGYFIPPEEDE